jgi:2C-methyl-D-erythritol 2,4-cyclodiphosphate synthase
MFCGESFTVTSELIKRTKTVPVLKTARQLEKEAELEKANMDWTRIRRVKKGLESSDTIMAEVSKALKAPKARITAVSRISKGRGKKFHLQFEGTAERNADPLTFDREKWRAVDWVYYVQPLVVPASI